MGRKIRLVPRAAVTPVTPPEATASVSATLRGVTSSIAEGWPISSANFTAGQASSADFTEPAGEGAPYELHSAATRSVVTPPTGITVNQTTGAIDYNGGGTPGTYGPYYIKSTQTTPTPEADWLLRTGQIAGNPYADGVLWYHDFRSASEVTNFRCDGTEQDPNGTLSGGNYNPQNTCNYVASNGITAGYLEVIRPTATQPTPGNAETKQWVRPFSGLTGATNGRGVNDPCGQGAYATTRRAYTVLQGSDNRRRFNQGYYTDPTTQAAYPSGPSFDGDEWYIQARIMFDVARWQGDWTAQNGGKLFFFSTMQQDNSPAEIVVTSYRTYSPANKSIYSHYHSSGPGFPGGEQNNSEYGVCSVPAQTAGCWYFDPGVWHTMLWHFKHLGPNSHLYEVYASRPGDTAYTLISTDTYNNVLFFDERNYSGFVHPPGQNALIFSCYQNGFGPAPSFWQRMSQVIFSRRFIPLPDDPVQRGVA